MINRKYPHIFSPITINGTTFRNRIWSAPAAVHLLAGNEEAPDDHVIAYYANKAKGGAAVITYSAMNMDLHMPYDPEHSHDTVMKPQLHARWHQLTDAIHFYGAKASLELLAFHYHDSVDGRLYDFTVNGGLDRDGNPTMMLDEAHMRMIAENYADAAENALACGFDMILVHGGHGLPLSQILSPVFNNRTDAFGGSLENRMKFPLMILKAIRKRVGDKLVIEYRISGSEMAGEEGFNVQDCIEVLKVFQKYIDIAHVSAGSFFNDTEHITHPSNYLPAGCNAYLAAEVKACPKIHIPVLAIGAFQMPELIEQTLAEGKADMVAMARGLIADSNLVQKAFYGREEDIIPCIRCFNCLDYERAPVFACAVNPYAGRELRLKWRLEKPVRKKRVLVIGGGPAGMEAAFTAAARGHEVILSEKSSVLGGMLIFSEQVSFKQGLKQFLHYQRRQIEKSGVKVLLNMEMTPEKAEALHPDAVIAALGSEPLRPDIPGINGNTVCTVMEAYEEMKKGTFRAENIVILGGGEAGCETGLYLAETLHRKVTLLEMKKEVAAEEFHITRTALLERMEKCVDIHTGARCTRITDNAVTYEDEGGIPHVIAADTVVLSLGMKAETREAEQFRSIAPEFRIVGDAVKAANVLQAVHDGFNAAVIL